MEISCDRFKTVALAALAVMTMSGAALAVTDEKGRELTAEEVAEKESRKACKIQMCDIFRAKRATGEKVACDIRKSWREEDIKDMVAGGQIGWRWGAMTCTFNLDLAQQELADAVSKADYDLKIKPHTINCKVAGKEGAEGHDISVAISPDVKFKDGKAIEGHLNWGDVTAPMLVKGIIWPGVALDNQVNFAGGKLVNLVNDFVTKKCDQVASELPSAKAQ